MDHKEYTNGRYCDLKEIEAALDGENADLAFDLMWCHAMAGRQALSAVRGPILKDFRSLVAQLRRHPDIVTPGVTSTLGAVLSRIEIVAEYMDTIESQISDEWIGLTDVRGEKQPGYEDAIRSVFAEFREQAVRDRANGEVCGEPPT